MMVDACAMISILTAEHDANAFENAIAKAEAPFTTALACFEASLVLSRADRLGFALKQTAEFLLDWLADQGIAVLPDPDAKKLLLEALAIADRFGVSKRSLSAFDCFHYAEAKLAGTGLITNDALLRQSGLPVAP